MVGLVLAAGAGRRLGPLTDDLPKTLLAVDAERTILDVALHNLAAAGLRDVVVVTGFAAHRIEREAPELERRHGVRLELVPNDRAEEWNNAYSLWCARDALARGVLLVNGDTLHAPEVERRLLDSRGPGIVLALDDAKPLGAEEMKVRIGPGDTLEAITKGMDPRAGDGEYIGVALVEPAAADALAEALEAVWRRDPQLYYEDGFKEFADRGGSVGLARVGGVPWIEVDDDADLTRARDIACHC